MKSNTLEEWRDPSEYYEILYSQYLKNEIDDVSILGLQPCGNLHEYLRVASEVCSEPYLLDIGAGNGRNTLASLKLGFKVDAVERSKSGCASIRNLTRGHPVNVINDCMESISFPNKYHSVLCRDTLHFLCLLYTSPSPRDGLLSRMPSSA